MKRQTNEKIGMKPVVFVIPVAQTFAEEEGDVPTTIHVLPVGEWDHPVYGKIVINTEDISEFVEHFNAGLRKDLPITEGHESLDEKPAIGWFRELLDKGAKGLYAVVEWTEQGKDLLRSKAYKYFSPEFYEVYEDPETREKYTNVLIGGALTNKPYFKELEPVVFSEPSIINQFNEPTMFKLEDVVKKNPSELSAEEKAFMKEHAAELSDEQKTAFADALKDEGADNGGEGGSEGEGDGNGAGGGADEGGGQKPPVNASEKGTVRISAAELKLLREQADKGAQAFQKLETKAIDEAVSQLTFSESNKSGKFLPKSKDAVTAFIKSLSADQRKRFSEIIAEIPEAKLFNELGSGDGADADTAAARVEAAVKKVMSEEKVSYSEAAKKVFAENPQLAKEYEDENPAA